MDTLSFGGGRYEATCASVHQSTQGRATLVIVVDGVNGTGFSVKAEAGILEKLPDFLRLTADSMDADRRRAKGN